MKSVEERGAFNLFLAPCAAPGALPLVTATYENPSALRTGQFKYKSRVYDVVPA